MWSLVQSGIEFDRKCLLFNEAVPVVLDEVPGKEVAGEALTHSVDDKGQFLSPDEVSVQTFLKDPEGGMDKSLSPLSIASIQLF